MSKNKVWGDQFTLQAAADVYNARIHVLESGRWNPNAKPETGQTSGHNYGVTLVVEPKEKKDPCKDVWISFAAQHYSPISPTPKTPPEILGAMCTEEACKASE